MNNSLSRIPKPVNEPVLGFAPGSPERVSLQRELRRLKDGSYEIPAYIGGRAVRTRETTMIRAPHEHSRALASLHQCGAPEVEQAIDACLAARHDWMRMPWTDRAAIFLRAADLLSGPWRDTINAATMLGQSKNPYQAEIDSACELIDFFRFNAYYMQQIYEDQPASPAGVWNRMEYRPLEGFVFAVTPFNFTSIQGNLPAAPALMGNTVIWKPSNTAAFSAFFIYKLLEEAGLPPGVINFLPGDGPPVGDPVFASPHFSGLHFTGSTGTFQHMWRTIGQNIDTYRTYPRIVGETGGKDFIMVHPSADAPSVAAAIVRGSFEYQGQKCSAASRVYLPDTLWSTVRESLLEQLDEVKMGPVEDFTNFVNAVIDQRAFDKITGYIDEARAASESEIIAGGGYSDAEGFYIEPTVILTEDPQSRTMREEIFGPVVTIYVYPERQLDETLALVNYTSPYALTGAIFARDRAAITHMTDRLVDAAGNFYINDKPTGAVVGQQPFGGARKSGTNDKAGSFLNLVRWVSARSIKETFTPPQHFGYPFLQPESTDRAVTATAEVQGV